MVASGCIGSLPGITPTKTPATGAGLSVAQGGDCIGALNGIDLENATLADLQSALSSGKITSVELVQAYVARIEAYDRSGPAVNSVQIINPNATAEAAALDAERAAGHVRGPLHGIPILLKDNVDTFDMPTTAGSIALATNHPPKDATIATKLRQAGAIILGKTKMSEFAQWISLNNPNGYSSLGGQVHNAYTGGDPSGSSSGSGVAGSMAFAAITVGTETQGSILGPSDANSLVGIKPTTGLVSRAGVVPLGESFDTPGPMARDVVDAATLLSVLAGPDPADSLTAPSASHLPPGGYEANLSRDALKGIRLGYDPNYKDPLFSEAKTTLTSLGAVLVPINFNDSPGTSELAVLPDEFKFGINQYLATEAGPGLPVKDLTDIILYNQQHPDKVKYGQDLLIASDATPGNEAVGVGSSTAAILAARAMVDHAFTQDRLDAMVGPDLAYYQTGAEAGYPTVIVPAGYNGKVPEGLSFFGQAWTERKLVNFAYAYEQASHKREPPTVVNGTLVQEVCVGGSLKTPPKGTGGNDSLVSPSDVPSASIPPVTAPPSADSSPNLPSGTEVASREVGHRFDAALDGASLPFPVSWRPLL
jgi:amidase